MFRVVVLTRVNRQTGSDFHFHPSKHVKYMGYSLIRYVGFVAHKEIANVVQSAVEKVDPSAWIT